MVKINLYKYSGRRNTVNKQLQVHQVLNGTLKDYFNYLNPDITVRINNLDNCNYCYIEPFNRYYFIDDVVVRDNGALELILSIDVLKTYERAILASTGETILQDNPNKYSSNRSGVYDLRPTAEKIEFPNKELFTKEGSIIMTTLKGKEETEIWQ